MKFSLPGILITLFVYLFSFSPTQASTNPNLEESIHTLSFQLVLVAGVIIALVVALTYIIKNEGDKLKTLFYILIALPTILVTVFLVGSTLYLNHSSVTGGPVHWHADFEIYNCGEKVDLINPKGLSNKIGTATFHEHNDDRIHVEGVVINNTDVNFGNFVKVIGGELSNDALAIPTTKGDLQMKTGDLCPDGTEGELQAFLYHVEGQNIVRNRIYDLPNYQFSPASAVPPGDCIIIEFGRSLTRTEHICESFEVAILKGKFKNGN